MSLYMGDTAPITPAETSAPDGYGRLRSVLTAAATQASAGKGKERHANNNAFEDQPICVINRLLGSTDGMVYQAIKKSVESKRLLRIKGADAAITELLGAINYLAAAVILIQDGVKADE